MLYRCVILARLRCLTLKGHHQHAMETLGVSNLIELTRLADQSELLAEIKHVCFAALASALRSWLDVLLSY